MSGTSDHMKNFRETISDIGTHIAAVLAKPVIRESLIASALLGSMFFYTPAPENDGPTDKKMTKQDIQIVGDVSGNAADIVVPVQKKEDVTFKPDSLTADFLRKLNESASRPF